jgi:hypothetical protein
VRVAVCLGWSGIEDERVESDVEAASALLVRRS